MEPAKIDWKKLDSKFVEDSLYEHINAPKWVNFLALDDHSSIDDEAFFCRPDCNHPKAAEDFLKTPPTSLKSKLLSTIDVNDILQLRNRNQRNAKSKRRGATEEDSENQDPNLSTPPPNSWKTVVKSHSEKKKNTDEKIQNQEVPRLKSTLSARNLFAGRDILGHITEFCNELKKLATRAKEKEKENDDNDKNKARVEVSRKVLGQLEVKEKERKPSPLLEKHQGLNKGSNSKEKQVRIKRNENAENIPMRLNMENVKQKGLLQMQIRTNPPSPQCFSVTRAPNKTTPPSRTRPTEKDKEEKGLSIVDGGGGGGGGDVFWFLKPCTLAS